MNNSENELKTYPEVTLNRDEQKAFLFRFFQHCRVAFGPVTNIILDTSVVKAANDYLLLEDARRSLDDAAKAEGYNSAADKVAAERAAEAHAAAKAQAEAQAIAAAKQKEEDERIAAQVETDRQIQAKRDEEDAQREAMREAMRKAGLDHSLIEETIAKQFAAQNAVPLN